MSNGVTLGEYHGVPCHHWDDELPLIAAVLRETKPWRTIELGTMYGGFAYFLADVVREWNGRVTTFDNVEYPEARVLADTLPNLSFVLGDVLVDGGAVDVRLLLRGTPTLLYCDNGNKEREVEIYAPLLERGSVLGVHDWNTEARPEIIDPIMSALDFDRFHWDAFAAMQRPFMSRFWIKR